MIPKKTNKILHFRIILSNKNSLRKLMSFKVDNVQGFSVPIHTPYEHTRRRHGEHSRAPHEDGPKDMLEARVHSATAHVLHSRLSLVLLAFLRPPLHPPPKSYFTESLTREISVRTMKVWVFRRNAYDSVTVAKSGFQKALVTGLLNWNNVCVPEKRKKWTPPRDIGRFPSLLLIHAANCILH